MRDLALSRERAALLVVDVQERLAAAMDPAALARVRRYVPVLLRAAARMGVPVVVSEQYPRGLGPTLPEIGAELPAGAKVVSKTTFSCGAVPEIRAALNGRQQVIVAGMEAHVCVVLTARDLAAAGHTVFVPHDAVASRREDDRQTGLALAREAGAVVTTSETVLFDLMRTSEAAEFRELSALIR